MIGSFYLEIFSINFLVITDITPEDWKEFYKKNKKVFTKDEMELVLKDIESPKTCGGSTTFLDTGDVIIFVRDKDKIGNWSHEIFHACNKTLLSRGFELTESGESWAYLIGYVTNLIMKWLKKNENKKG